MLPLKQTPTKTHTHTLDDFLLSPPCQWRSKLYSSLSPPPNSTPRHHNSLTPPQSTGGPPPVAHNHFIKPSLCKSDFPRHQPNP
ncbi:hypothetical protein L6452_00176 [Arctium lappa]|uniref:Uncharacterized protein n=1 Tax=Arctium lappa TaxID=4217 RepID=A0ACB9FD54_ARCLA|nr:hypothetical protein L6452_00176 [Arctium lappa]